MIKNAIEQAIANAACYWVCLKMCITLGDKGKKYRRKKQHPIKATYPSTEVKTKKHYHVNINDLPTQSNPIQLKRIIIGLFICGYFL